MFPRQSVLIVDPSPETREVLRTALAPRGASVLEASRAEQGLALARRHHPDVIVLDLEIGAASPDTISQGFAAESQQSGAPIVFLGSARRIRHSFPTGQFVAKPYHYAPLIRKIERLLDEAQRSGPRDRRAA